MCVNVCVRELLRASGCVCVRACMRVCSLAVNAVNLNANSGPVHRSAILD